MASFEFQIVLTERCNMACTYCYMSNRPKDMTIEVFDKHYNFALPQLLRRYQRQNYHVALFGGEPLLNWELIEYIIPIVKKDPRCTAIIALTNGLEFRKEHKRKYFEEHGLGFSLSFDGLWNKDTRLLKDGSSSFELYTSEPLKSYFSGKGGCKVMVAPQNIDTMVENYIWFVEEYKINSPDFSLVRDDVWTDEDIQKFDIYAKLLAGQMIDYIKSGVPTLVGFFQLYILDLLFGSVQGKRPFGCFAGCGGAGFMPDGKVYPCARYGSTELTPIYDSLEQTEISNLGMYLNPNLTNPQTFLKCQECTLYKYCNAGCTFEQTKHIHSNESFMHAKPLDNICSLLHILYRESIRIVDELKDNTLFKNLVEGLIKNVG
ncbi:MAG: SPASM domain-containing protein [Melioribacteraceae bacterium]|nr:SPASM domain-containing protein [Melioribacteraceae bacterium]